MKEKGTQNEPLGKIVKQIVKFDVKAKVPYRCLDLANQVGVKVWCSHHNPPGTPSLKSMLKHDWLVVEPTHFKNMLVKLEIFPK